MDNWKIYVDTGGTFTDCIAISPKRKKLKTKVLSSSTLRGVFTKKINSTTFEIQQNWGIGNADVLAGFSLLLNELEEQAKVLRFDAKTSTLYLSEPLKLNHFPTSFSLTTFEEAPILAARLLTNTSLNQPFPPLQMRLGTTKGTNALLEHKGAPFLFFVTKGFKDLLEIGTQQRPDLFTLNIQKSPMLYQEVIEIEERLDAQGNSLQEIDYQKHEQLIARLVKSGYRTAAVAFIHSHLNPSHELEFAQYLTKKGITSISISSALSTQMNFLARAETAVVNAYLSPIINQYLGNIHHCLNSNLQNQKTSSLHIMTSAGGLVMAEDFHPKDSLLSGPAGGVVGAAKSSEKSGYQKIISFDMGGTSTDVARYHSAFDYRFSLKIGQAQLLSPALAIETVAAGGGSICAFDGYKLTVGPESAGAWPGPACYGAGGPLTITDVHLLLGRLEPSQFSIPISKEAANQRLIHLLEAMEAKNGKLPRKTDILKGFLDIANEIMAGAIRKISFSKGYETKDYALTAFGGAGGLHACQLADKLDMKTVIIPQNAGILSAWGIGQAAIERFAETLFIRPLEEIRSSLPTHFKTLENKALASLHQEHISNKNSQIRERLLFLRYQGQNSSLEIPYVEHEDIQAAFEAQYQKIYGHTLERPVELESIRVVAASISANKVTINASKSPTRTIAKPDFYTTAFFEEKWVKTPVYQQDKLRIGDYFLGPALILDKHCTTVLESHWEATLDANKGLILQQKTRIQSRKTSKIPEAVALELFTNRFKAIAENMGVMLQRTALSVNVKERLDFSCALLDAKGELIVNAPHIPVHLGSLGVCVRLLKAHIPMENGDTVITNHPAFGGSHLPDVTLVTPVFSGDKELLGYVASRAHHAEIGGTRPGSMPPDATSLREEGVIIPPQYLVKNNCPNWDAIRVLLEEAPYPTRRIEENIADLNAALASNLLGVQSLKQLAVNHSIPIVKQYMDLLKHYTAERMGLTLKKLPLKHFQATEYLDDGTPISVSITIKDATGIVDFSGTGSVHPRNLNANRAIVTSAVLYVFRLLLNESLPLNDGLLYPIQIILPPNSLVNPTFPEDPASCPAVVGGNTETSQRVTNTLLKALGIIAGSQGTMNNIIFGNASFGYYETIGGGCGAGDGFHGASATHSHMTNTRITDAETLEHRYPVRLLRFAIRKNSGGQGKFQGGDGIEREYLFLAPIKLSVLTQNRVRGAFGLEGGEAGKAGKQFIIKKNGDILLLKSIDGVNLEPDDRLVVQTPGGGGFGKHDNV